MYKHVSLLVRREGLSHAEFVEDWQTRYAPTVADIDGVVRFQEVFPTDPGHAEFDGLSELYFEDLEALTDAFGDPGSGESASVGHEDVDDLLAVADRSRFVGRVTVRKDEVDGDTDGLYKHSAFLVRKEGLSHGEFVEYWQTNHTPIAREIEGVVKYDTVVPVDPETAAFDGVAELYFEDLEALYAALGSEGSRDYDPDRGKAKEAREDVDEFLAVDERPRFIGRERLVEVER